MKNSTISLTQKLELQRGGIELPMSTTERQALKIIKIGAKFENRIIKSFKAE